jgi:hypothetical protein
MSEINRGIPEGVTQRAPIIDFEAAKGKRLEAETRQAQWIQERTQQQAVPGVAGDRPAGTPIHTEVPPEADQPPQGGRRVEFSTPTEGQAGENRPLAESTHIVIDFQKAREDGLVTDQANTGILPESNKFTQSDVLPRSNEAGDTGIHDPEDTDRDRENKHAEDIDDPETETPDKEQIIAMGVIGSKLEQFNLPLQKRQEIFTSLADDPNAIIKVAGVIKHLTPDDPMAILEEGAAFRKRIDEALERARLANEQQPRELTILELICLLLGTLLTFTAEAIQGEEVSRSQ